MTRNVTVENFKPQHEDLTHELYRLIPRKWIRMAELSRLMGRRWNDLTYSLKQLRRQGLVERRRIHWRDIDNVVWCYRRVHEYGKLR